MILKRILAATTFAVAAFAAVHAQFAHADTVNVAYQYGADPAKLAQAGAAYEKATGWKINWRRFDSGADVVAALASGDVQIGDVGQSPFTAAVSRGVPIQAVVLNAITGVSEALVVRSGAHIDKPADLVGKTIATPYASNCHYALLAALKHWGIDAQRVKIVNLGPTEIVAAWERGVIDAAYTWDPALGRAKASGGKVLVDSAQVGKWGAPTFDLWAVRSDFARAHPDFVSKFVNVTTQAIADYRANAKAWTSASPQVAAISRLSGATTGDIPQLLAGNLYPTASEQASPELLGGGTAAAIASTARFLKEQRKIDRVLPDYRPTVTDQFVRASVAAR
ncbi:MULTISPECIES: taurine ABC transporter substrate-binding protein [Burkholderia]|uniref:Taurine ABC transporter substrate-binding protein n=1 Tax=Burkholderia savannae TaxID=1637837 RepID=A0ABR5T3T1_9BURK|nr:MULTISPECIES: taurine ABC transporter substrate-binding protein [Burkholderia]AOJ71207.1 taurine ABC transporter substrate-binding protein [Burkholderia savannae]AOK49603.1 taurine ABC transporter substrate-binding protein [Burkholderia sp. MSMB617WGS]KGS08345.1 taurine ABC transporter, periplasmic binding protein [Burkholderia sp. ABCPW 111]KVG48723.1 taurine ABC transporter substrate-binding protein [Burkholderia sp. MSMB0265]KVG86181.1 taurine ABC transporter substrate-binding protein [B